jgi:hypothetical protein
MKYLKRYNEELTPANTKNLKTAARSALQLNQPERSNKFRDYSDTKDFGVYNIDLYRSSGISLTKDLTFTEVTFDNIIYGVNTSYTNLYKDPEEVVRRWGAGDGNLAITFDVCFKPTRETFKKIGNSFDIKGANYTKLGSHFINIKNDYRLTEEVKLPLFRISLILATAFNDYCEDCGGAGEMECHTCDGSGEEWYNGGDDVRPCPDCEHGNVTCNTCNGSGLSEQMEISDRFDRDKCFILNSYPAELHKNIGVKESKETILGTFADRISARKFQKELPSIFEKSEIKSKIVDVLSILKADSDDIENAIDLFYNIPVSAILPERGDKVAGPDDAKKYMNKNSGKRIKQIFPKKD